MLPVEPGDDRAAYERVDELERATGAKDAGVAQVIGRRQRFIHWKPRKRGRALGGCRRIEHGHRGCQPACGFR